MKEQFEVQWIGLIQADQWWKEGVLCIQHSHRGPAPRTFSWAEGEDSAIKCELKWRAPLTKISEASEGTRQQTTYAMEYSTEGVRVLFQNCL